MSALLSGTYAASAAAQSGPVQSGTTPTVGDRVQVLIDSSATVPGDMMCDGSVTGVARDTLVLAPMHGCPRGQFVARVRVFRGDRGERVSHVKHGALGGVIGGAIVGRLVGGDGCSGSTQCADGGLPVRIFTVAGAVVGALVGGVIGAMQPDGPQWELLRTARSVRIAGLALRPGLLSSPVAARHR